MKYRNGTQKRDMATAQPLPMEEQMPPGTFYLNEGKVESAVAAAVLE